MPPEAASKMIGQFFVHAKHDPALGLNDHTYEVIAIAWDKDYEGPEGKGRWMVVYRMLYRTPDFNPPIITVALSRWNEPLDKPSGPYNSLLRYAPVTEENDRTRYRKLVEVAHEMYGRRK